MKRAIQGLLRDSCQQNGQQRLGGAWDFVSEVLVAKAWECCGYKTYEDLNRTTPDSAAITLHNENAIVGVLSNAFENKEDGADVITYHKHSEWMIGDEEAFDE